MDEARAQLDHRVAEAAEAWLADPRDAGVYARLVAAVAQRREALDPAGTRRDDAEAAGAQDALPADGEPPVPPLRPVGADLVGDPRAVLDRLRRS